MNDHHLILGTVTDIITGETLVETHDEQLRQGIARLLVNALEYDGTDVTTRHYETISVDHKAARICVDFVIEMDGTALMIIKYGPGSLVTRHRAGLALARLIRPYQIPVVVVTNGRDADVLDGRTGGVTGSGLAALPARPVLASLLAQRPFPEISPRQREMAARIVYAFEIDDKCPCDDTHECLSGENMAQNGLPDECAFDECNDNDE